MSVVKILKFRFEYRFIFFIFAILCMSTSLVHAEIKSNKIKANANSKQILSGNIQRSTAANSSFNLKLANQRLNKLKIWLASQTLGLEELEIIADEIVELQDNAKISIENIQENIEILDRLFLESKIDADLRAESVEYKYIQDKKQFYNKNISEYRLFVSDIKHVV